MPGRFLEGRLGVVSGCVLQCVSMSALGGQRQPGWPAGYPAFRNYELPGPRQGAYLQEQRAAIESAPRWSSCRRDVDSLPEFGPEGLGQSGGLAMRTKLPAPVLAAMVIMSSVCPTATAGAPEFVSGVDTFVMHVSVEFFHCGAPFVPCGGKAELPVVPEGSAIVVRSFYVEANPCLEPRTIKFWGFDGSPGPFDGLNVMHTQILSPQPEAPPFAQASGTEIWLSGTDFMQVDFLDWRPVIQINTGSSPGDQCSSHVGDVTVVYRIQPLDIAE